MKHTLALVMSFSLVQSLAPVTMAKQNSIEKLSQLSKMAVRQYDCRLAHLPEKGDATEKFFSIGVRASGHGAPEFAMKAGTDDIVASASSQMLGIYWSRDGKVIANSQAWVKGSGTNSFVIIAADPAAEANQIHLSCDAVTFDQSQPEKGAQ